MILFKRLQIIKLFFQIFIAVSEDEPKAEAVDLIFNAARKLRKERVCDIRQQQSDQSGLPL